MAPAGSVAEHPASSATTEETDHVRRHPSVRPPGQPLGGDGRTDPSDYGTHSLRRTKATLIYRRTKNLRAVQLLLGHTKLESTVKYLGAEVEDALEISEQTEV
jgi:integrase